VGSSFLVATIAVLFGARGQFVFGSHDHQQFPVIVGSSSGKAHGQQNR